MSQAPSIQPDRPPAADPEESRQKFVSVRSFQGPVGTSEHYLVVNTPADLTFVEQLGFLHQQYCETLHRLGLRPETAIFRRIFLSDILNQAALVETSELASDSAAVSLVQQPPLPASRIALLAYHIASPEPLNKLRLSPKHLLVRGSGQRHLWSTCLCASGRLNAVSSETQTREVFSELIQVLAQQRCSLRDHCLRTWLYLKDVDVFYDGMVNARRELFSEQGMTAATHYIASTGIEGACSHGRDLVTMDAYCNLDLVPGQISYLNDFQRLCGTRSYNVTFERGTRVAYADRAHYFISGTASINCRGDVVHPGDVLRQTERTIDNIDALLRSASATLDELMYLMIYLRDATDFAPVKHYVGDRLPDVPVVFVQAAVCRPAWLIEAEGVAIIKNSQPNMPSL